MGVFILFSAYSIAHSCYQTESKDIHTTAVSLLLQIRLSSISTVFAADNIQTCHFELLVFLLALYTRENESLRCVAKEMRALVSREQCCRVCLDERVDSQPCPTDTPLIPLTLLVVLSGLNEREIGFRLP